MGAGAGAGAAVTGAGPGGGRGGARESAGGRRGRGLLGWLGSDGDYSDSDYSGEEVGSEEIELDDPGAGKDTGAGAGAGAGPDAGAKVEGEGGESHGRELRGAAAPEAAAQGRSVEGLHDTNRTASLAAATAAETRQPGERPNCECACCLPGDCLREGGDFLLEARELHVASPAECRPDVCAVAFPEACPEPARSRLAEAGAGAEGGQAFATFFDCVCECEKGSSGGAGSGMNFFAGSAEACSPGRCREVFPFRSGCPADAHPSAEYVGAPAARSSTPPPPPNGAFTAGLVVGALGLAALLAVAASVAVEAFRRRAGHGRRGDSAGRGRPAAGPVSSSWDPAGARAPALVPPRSPVCEP